MPKFSLFFFLICLTIEIKAQSYKAITQEDYTLKIEKINLADPISFRNNDFVQMASFPKKAVGHPSFKDFRNVSLADLNGDGKDDILFATNHTLFAYTTDSLLWKKDLVGIGIYPPAVADVDHDGDLEIVQATGEVGPNGSNGRVYLLDHTGQDISGWPLNFNNHWILASPALADVDGNGKMEIIINERVAPGGKVHLLQLDGTSFNENWPVSLSAVPAVTPSIGDVDNDGEIDIVVFSSESRYVFDLAGQTKPGFPQLTHPLQRYSFQSPILADLNADNKLEIIGATHSFETPRDPYFFIINSNGNFLGDWPLTTALSSGTFNTPTVVKIDGTYKIFMSLPIGGEAENEMLFGWDINGTLLNGFPIKKTGGLEGIISVADIDNDDEYELIFSSNLITNGFGFIHAYEMDGSGEVTGFPLRPRGFTHMNGAALGDVNGDGNMDLVAISYTNSFGQEVDSSYLNVYELNVPYALDKILWGTYKGNNSRDGLLKEVISSTTITSAYISTAVLVPNPTSNSTNLWIELQKSNQITIQLYSSTGKRIQQLFAGFLSTGKHQIPISLNHLPAGLYWINIKDAQGEQFSKKLIKY